MMFDPNSIHDLQYSTEKQILDRKSARISAKDFAVPVAAMANADGGWLVIGIEDDGTITGTDDFEKNMNDLLRVPFDFCIPSVQVENVQMDVIDKDGRPNHIHRMRIFPSSQVISNQADDVYLRVGDKSKKMNFEQRLQLVYAKGFKYFEDQPVYGAAIDDIDLDFVTQYCEKIGYNKGDAEYYLRHNNDFITIANGEEHISGAAILLFGKDPQRFFPRARIRFVRYDGKTAEVGDRMNVIKDKKFSGRILDQVRDAVAFVQTQIREYTKLGPGAVFQTTPEYPEFCWMELIVNAVAHRDYSIKGTDIQIKMFDDHFLVESPGMLPGLVRVNNIREFHFSRNPKIVEFLNEYDLVKEFGEGVDRIFRDMQDAGLPDPEYKQSEFMLYAALKNKTWDLENGSWESLTSGGQDGDQAGDHVSDQAGEGVSEAAGGQVSGQVETSGQANKTSEQFSDTADQNRVNKLIEYCSSPKTRQEMMAFLGLNNRDYFRKEILIPLLESGKLKMTIPDKPNSSKQKYVKVE